MAIVPDSPPGSPGGLLEKLQAVMGEDALSVQSRQLQNAEDDETFAATVRQNFDMADKARRGQEKSWKECIAFIEGIQYIISDLQTSVWLNTQANTRPGSERVIDNVLYDHSQRLLAQIAKPTYAPSIQSGTDMPEDYDGSRIGQILCRNAYHAQKVPKLKRDLTWWVIVCGPGWVETYFDPEEGQNGRAGMVVRSPFQVYPDPRFSEWDRCRWCIVTETASRSDALDRYAESFNQRTGKNLADELPKDTSVKVNQWMPEASVRPGSDSTGVMSPPPSVKDAVTIQRYYERPSSKHEQGRHGVIIEGKTVHRSDLETPQNKIPLTPFGFWNRPWDLMARSPVSMCVNLQRLYNYGTGRWYEHIKRWAAGWLLIDNMSGITRGSLTNQPDMIRYNPGHEPKFVYPPFGNTQGYVAFRNEMRNSIAQRMGLPPVMYGEMPKGGTKAAKSLEILRETSEENRVPIVEDLADSWTEVWKQMLGWMEMKYNNQDIIAITGQDKQGTVTSFKAGSIPANWQDRWIISVDTGGALPTGRLARMQTILELSRKDLLFGRPGTPEHARQLKQALGFDAGYLESETDLDRAIAQQENIALRAFQMLNVHELDDDETHIAEHMAYAKQLIVQSEPEQIIKGYFMPHINLHRQQLASKHKDLQEQPAPPAEPGGGGAPQAPFGAEGQQNAGTKGPGGPGPMGQG